jgi:hypothetical protein
MTGKSVLQHHDLIGESPTRRHPTFTNDGGDDGHFSCAISKMLRPWLQVAHALRRHARIGAWRLSTK